MRTNLPSLLDDQFEPLVREFAQAWRAGRPITVPKAVEDEYLPVRVTKKMKTDQQTGGIKVDVLVGRSSWLFSLKTVLNGPADVLADYRWTIQASRRSPLVHQ